MTALDTNVVVRILTGDDREQLEAALGRLRGEALWLPKTVLLETEWVLRYTYDLKREAIGEALRKLLGYGSLQVEDRGTVLRALSWYSRGLDFADASHLASSADAERFLTFDRQLAKAAGKLDDGPLVELAGPRSR